MRSIKISEIFDHIKTTNKNIIMLLNADYSVDEKKIIENYGTHNNKKIKFVTMKELLFNNDDDILKIR